ncbi:unnamed protein product [Adineta steineri]|uniref:Peptidase C45 hydrolase domain-containing protein n=1 Tax=Adineta steineri TaxID=433720 RepID=A0A820ICK3_9BILA|nr:unnamed protein product [Adineta steineri]
MFSCSCDTMVVMSDVTDDGSIIFGKNSDRQTNEPLSTRYIPSSINSLNSKVKATHIEIDQVEKTYSCILFSPTNIFGAEMGFNCHGLVVGNEALFTKIPSYNDGLTGMDLVRLVLERCSTSREGKNEILSLINKYGQGGNSPNIHQMYQVFQIKLYLKFISFFPSRLVEHLSSTKRTKSIPVKPSLYEGIFVNKASFPTTNPWQLKPISAPNIFVGENKIHE